MSDFTNGAHECFCDRQYKDANKFATCGDCPRDYIAGAWDARKEYVEEHSKMTDRYERIRALLAERDALVEALEAAREDGARLRETLRDVTGVAICGLYDTHREDTLREFSLQELIRVTEVTAPLMEEGVTVESVYRRGYDAAIDQAREASND